MVNRRCEKIEKITGSEIDSIEIFAFASTGVLLYNLSSEGQITKEPKVEEWKRWLKEEEWVFYR
jgi:hypothetical protein